MKAKCEEMKRNVNGNIFAKGKANESRWA